MRESRANPSPGARLLTLAVFVALVVALFSGVLSVKQPAARPLLAFVSGAAAASAAFMSVFGFALARMAAICERMETGDLSISVPERAPRLLRPIAAALNGLSADFQEVLLLFAHLVRSAEASVQMLSHHASSMNLKGEDARRLGEIETDIHEMKLMIRDFKYFRVSVDEDAIRDTGLPAHTRAASGSRPVSPEPSIPAAVTAKGDGV